MFPAQNYLQSNNMINETARYTAAQIYWLYCTALYYQIAALPVLLLHHFGLNGW